MRDAAARLPGSWLDEATPGFARRLGRGIADGDEPAAAGGASLGQHRARLSAAGLVAAWRDGRTSPRERLARVAQAFADAGVDPAAPYRDRGAR